jgi:carbonic anhydrase
LGEREEVSLGEVIEENVLVQVDHLKSHPAVSSALREDRLRIFGWVYHFETGSVSVYDPRRKKFFPSEEVKEAVAKEATHFSL